MIELKDHLAPEYVPQLMGLFANEWWTAGRLQDDVVAMLEGSDLIFALVDRSEEEQLVGFARVITDGVYLAIVLDVIVAAEMRGQGLGQRLMDAVAGHPRLAGVQSVELVCQPDKVEFYRRLGFTDEVGQSRLMRHAS